MFGSIFYNFWAAIIGFSLYFFCTLSDASLPLNSIVKSLLVAVVSFVLMYAIRLLLGYILYTPEEDVEKDIENEQLGEQPEFQNSKDSVGEGTTSTIDIKDESVEDIANVVKSMLLQDEPPTK
ncbi:MAG TPA: hypothetical protein VNS08_15905 [Ureibacillus sp.]|nr:hypothetical protein [Ureibacillus sp.]